MLAGKKAHAAAMPQLALQGNVMKCFGKTLAAGSVALLATVASAPAAAAEPEQCACIINRLGDLRRTNASVNWGPKDSLPISDLPKDQFRSYCFTPPGPGKPPLKAIFRLPNHPGGEPANLAFELRLSPRRTAKNDGRAICASLDTAAIHAIVYQTLEDHKAATLIFNVTEFVPEKPAR
jgi:hypothetical protein